MGGLPNKAMDISNFQEINFCLLQTKAFPFCQNHSLIFASGYNDFWWVDLVLYIHCVKRVTIYSRRQIFLFSLFLTGIAGGLMMVRNFGTGSNSRRIRLLILSISILQLIQ
jgi:hypothetical protein